VDLRDSKDAIQARPISTLVNHETNELFIRDLEVPAENLIGEEGAGFRYVLDGLNAERILIAAECIGDGEWFVERSVDYAKSRVVFDRPIGKNQGIQFPIAQAYAKIKAADLVRYKATFLFDANKKCGEEANLAKFLASDASWEAANVAMTVHGGYGMATDFDIERKMRENRLYIVAPISNNLVLSFLGEHVLGPSKSY